MNILGHEKQLFYLRRVVERERVAHALLFEGPEGVGKKKTALYLAQLLNCRSQNACGSCPACRKTVQCIHPDLTVLEPDGQFVKIGQIRELSEFMRLRPYEGKTKVAIIDQAERFNINAGNALLKTLEDPPGHSIMILVTSNPGALPPTVRSRCQSMSFSRIPEKELAAYLREKGRDRPELRAALAEGSISRAFEDIDEYLQFRNDLLEKLRTLNQIEELFTFAEKSAGAKADLEKLLICLQGLFRDKWLLTHEIDSIRNRDIIERLRAWEISGKEAEKGLWSIEQAGSELKFNVTPRLLWETVLLGLPQNRS